MDVFDATEAGSRLGLRSRIAVTIGPAVVWTVWAAALLASILYIRHYTRNVPFGEDFCLVSVMTGHEPISWEWTWAHANEHRTAVPRLIMGNLLHAIPDLRVCL